MVTTRSQHNLKASGEPPEIHSLAIKGIAQRKGEEYGEAQEANQHGVKLGNQSENRGAEQAEKSTKQASPAFDNSALGFLLTTYGSFPLEASALPEPKSPTPPTLLAHLLNALLSSARISHAIASKTTGLVIEVGYANLETLEKSTWEERTQVLTEGGYTHYREKTATELREVAEWVRRECRGDLNTILQHAKQRGEGAEVKVQVRKKLKEVKGFGEVAADIFFNTAQGVWGELAPSLDSGSQKTAERIGLPGNAEKLFEVVQKSPVNMARLASALTEVRLERREYEF